MRCSRCGTEGVRLWRTTPVFASQVELFCVACGLDREKEHLGGDDFGRSLKKHLDCGSLGYLVAARPTEDGSFWGHTSGPESSVTAWCALPFSAITAKVKP